MVKDCFVCTCACVCVSVGMGVGGWGSGEDYGASGCHPWRSSSRGPRVCVCVCDCVFCVLVCATSFSDLCAQAENDPHSWHI